MKILYFNEDLYIKIFLYMYNDFGCPIEESSVWGLCVMFVRWLRTFDIEFF